MSVQLWSSSGRATEGQTPLSSAEALLCDMDGTLVDSSAVVESMWASFARDHGMSERFDEIMAYSPGRTGLDTNRRADGGDSRRRSLVDSLDRRRRSAGPGDLRIADFTTH